MAVYDYVKLYRDKGKEYWGRLNTKQKFLFSSIGAVIVLAFVLMIGGFGSGNGGKREIELAGSTDPSTALRKLRSFGIAASQEAGAITVPAELEERATLILATSNFLPNGKEHYKFLHETSLTQTDHRMREAMRIELQEILAGTISAMDFVNQAEVNITPPSKPFEFRLPDKDLMARATVTIGLKNQDSLSEGQVAGLASLVGNSWETLTPDNVAIVDTKGRAYHFNREEWENSVTYWQQKKREEDSLNLKVENLLRPYGATAQATVRMKMDKISKREKKYNSGDEGKILIEESREHKENGESRSGASGATAEMGRDDSNAPGNIVKNTNREESEARTSYGHDTVEITSEDDKIRPLFDESTIAVSLSDEFKDKLKPARLDELKALVSNATSIPVENISMTLIPSISRIGEGGSGTMGGLASRYLTTDNIIKGILLVLALGAFVALMLMLKKSAPKPLTLVEEDIVEEEPEPLPVVPKLPPVDQLEGNLVREKVVELAKRNPKAAANLIKRWMILGK